MEQPEKTIRAYKIFQIKKKKEGLFPLFIGKTEKTPVGEWIEAKDMRTKGYARRPGWHCGILPLAPHLRTKNGKIKNDRVWAEVEVPNDINWQVEANKNKTKDIQNCIPKSGYYFLPESKKQGGGWIIGGGIKIIRILQDSEVFDILTLAGIPAEEALKECKEYRRE